MSTIPILGCCVFSYNPQEVPEQTKNNISNVLQNYHIKAEAAGMFSPCFHHIFENKNVHIHRERVFCMGFDHIRPHPKSFQSLPHLEAL